MAALSRSREADDPELVEARRDLRCARAEDYIKALVDAAPPLTDEQRRRLSVLLNGQAPPADQLVAGANALQRPDEVSV